MTDQWTPWRSHTPGPCPVPVGTWIQIEQDGGWRGRRTIKEGRLTQYMFDAPNWYEDGNGYYTRITRYRIRITPGMQLLNEALKVKEVEHA